MADAGEKLSGSTVIPAVRYRDAHAAIDWLVRVLGFTAKAVYDGPEGTVAHAELTLGAGMIMLGSASNAGVGAETRVHPDEIGGRSTHGIYLVVPDAGPVYERAQAAGSPFIQELTEMSYGGRAFICKDPEGYVWSVGEYDPWAPQAGT
jgi:uncharacterized glyoxalase superfamily protein PhnB